MPSQRHPGAETLRHPSWHAINTGWGSQRATHPPITTEHLLARLVRMPPGQRSPWHGSGGWPESGRPFPPLGGGSIFLVVDGEVQFDVFDAELATSAFDMLRINAAIYSYMNPGAVDAYFWVLHGRPVGVDDVSEGGTGEPWTTDPLATRMMGSHPYYDERPAHGRDLVPDADDRVGLVAWRDLRRGRIEWSGEWGACLGRYDPVATNFETRVIRVPPGQRGRLPSFEHDGLLIGVEGRLDVTDGAIAHRLDPFDVITLEAAADVSCWNPSSVEVRAVELRAVPRRGAGTEPA